MQDTLHCPSATASATGIIRQPLPKTTITYKPLSSNTTFQPPPLKPPPLPLIPAPPSHDLIPSDVPHLTLPDNYFQDKIYFLDSQGLDPLSNLPPSAISASASLHDLQSVFHYLTSLGFTPPDLRRSISMCPLILSLNLRQIASVFTFLLREARVPASSLRRTIHRRPRLLISDVDSRLRPTMYFLQSIGIHEVHNHTHLLSSSVEDKYLPKILYFQNLGFTYLDSVSMFRKFPALFCYSVKDNFEPKFNYFVVEMGRDFKELKEFPHYFSFSLDKRIKPRHQLCVDTGVCLPLPLMLKLKEDKFRERLDVCSNSTLPRTTSPLWRAETTHSLI